MLTACGFTESAICARCGVSRIDHFERLRDGRAGGPEIHDTLDALIRLLMDGEAVPEETLRRFLPAGGLEALLDLDIAVPTVEDAALLGATAHLYCVGGLFIASDRTFPLSPSNTPMPEDIVYSAITTNTGRFLSFVPSDPCGDLLDLCSGSGAAALIAASRYARRAWAADLGARSVHFSEFNRRLNHLPNAAAVQGDLYFAVQGLKFDRILAHPPYVPAEEQKILFRDGGEDGELIFRRIIEGLPEYLRPGGRAYILTRATDRENAPLQNRIRQWLGPAQDEFDVILVLHEEQPGPDEYERLVTKIQGEPVHLGRGAGIYRRLKATALLYAVVVVERHQEKRAAVSARCRKAKEATSDAVEWFRQWQQTAASPTFHGLLLASRPRPSGSFRLDITHAFDNGALTPVDFRLKTEYPYVTNARIEPWIAFLLGFCDGTRSCGEVLNELRSQDVVGAEMSQEEFLSIIGQLVGAGFLEIPEMPLPKPVQPVRPA